MEKVLPSRQPFQETWRTFLSIIELLAGRPGWLVDYERDPQPDERAVPVFEPYDVNYLVLGTDHGCFLDMGSEDYSAQSRSSVRQPYRLLLL